MFFIMRLVFFLSRKKSIILDMDSFAEFIFSLREFYVFKLSFHLFIEQLVVFVKKSQGMLQETDEAMKIFSMENLQGFFLCPLP